MTLPALPLPSETFVDQEQKITLPWQVFLESIANGDTGTSWSPNFQGLITDGTPQITGVYYQISQSLVYYRILITPATSTSSTLGTTYCDNFPLTFANDSANTTVSSYTAATSGTTAVDNRIYTATWTTIGSPITILGIAEVQ